MQVSSSLITPFQIIRAVENLTDAEKETLAIMADEKLSEELMDRRKQLIADMKTGGLLSEEELFRGM
jgi:hypothetical protein